MVPHCGVHIGDLQKLISMYADDIKLMCTSECDLNDTVFHIEKFLALVGLEVEVSKSQVVVVGAPQISKVVIRGTSLAV